MRDVGLALVVALLAGCAAPAALEGAGAPPAALPEAAYRLRCADGADFAPSCVKVLLDPVAHLSEPSLALLSGRPDVMAVGVHAVGPTALAPAAQAVQGRVYVTEDGGATWRWSALPLPSDARPGSYFSDPSLAFDAEGRLHASGMVLGMTQPPDVFATSSPDLGRTWTPPVRLATGQPRVDRNWESVAPDGRVFVTWQSSGATSHAAWSADGGATWDQLEEGPDGCFTTSPAAFVGGDVWLACATREEGLSVYRLGDAGALDLLGRAPGMGCIAPRLLPERGGGVVMTCYGGLATRSDDGGRTWTPPTSLVSLSTIAAGWQGTVVKWSALDPNGSLHVELAPFHRPAPADYARGTEQRVAHLVVDPRTMTLLAEARLTPEGPERQSRLPMSAAPPLGDDWWGIEFTGGEGRMVWMRGGAIEWAALLPT